MGVLVKIFKLAGLPANCRLDITILHFYNLLFEVERFGRGVAIKYPGGAGLTGTPV